VAWGFTYILIGLIGFVLSIFAVKKKDISGFRYFAAFAFLQAVWAFCYGLELLLPSFFAKVLVAKIEYLPIVTAPILWLVFALSYTKFSNWINFRKWVLLSIIPAITLILIATNEFHGLVWSKLELVDTNSGINIIDYSYGSWFWVQAIYTYSIFFISFAHLVASLFSKSEHQRKAVLFLIFCALIPIFFNAVYIFDPEFFVDLTPLGYFASIVVIIWGLFYNNLFSMKSTAREAVLELMQDAVIITDAEQKILDLNQPATNLLKKLNHNSSFANANLHGQHIDTLFPVSSQFIPFDGEIDANNQQLSSTTSGAGEFAKIHVDLQERLEKKLKVQLSKTDAGVKVLSQLPKSAVGTADQAYNLDVAQGEQYFKIRVSNFSSVTKQRGRVLVIQDVTVQKEQDKLLEEMVFFDKLTDLYNRYSFMQYGKLLLQQQVPVSLLLIDLDRFRNVNESLGHTVGDDLLIQVAKRLANVVSESDTLARLGTDEFAVLTSEEDPNKVKALAEDILLSFRSPYSLQGQVVHMNASIGIVIAEQVAEQDAIAKDAVKIGDLLRHADIAMYEAKHQGLGYSIYSSKETVTSLRKLNLETELIQAIEESEFEMFYQPIVQAHNSGLVGFEALIRWQKDGNYIGPAQFLSFAEEVGKMKLIDYWVLERVITRDKALLPPGFVALNLSGSTLRDTGLIDLTKKLLAQGYKVDDIVLEVTEGAMMNVGIATSILNQLKSLGYQIAIDDFGTGYSSLSYIENFPLDILKIDKSFVNGIGKSDVSEALLRTIINLGQNLGVAVLAEGIETSEQDKWLLANDCLFLQGHLFGWPKPVDYYKDGYKVLSPDEASQQVKTVSSPQHNQAHNPDEIGHLDA